MLSRASPRCFRAFVLSWSAVVGALDVGCAPFDDSFFDGADGSDGVTAQDLVTPNPGRLVVNEVQCAKAPEEWVELLNVGETTVVPRGMTVADRLGGFAVAVPERPVGPGQRLLVSGDLSLSCANDGVVLLAQVGVLDQAPVRPPEAQHSERATWGRVPDGIGRFVETAPTPHKANVAFVDGRAQVFTLQDSPAADGVVGIVDLYVDGEAEERLRVEGKGAGYVPAVFTYTDVDGTSPPQRVDVRIKGSITLRPWEEKPSLKIHFARHDARGPQDFRGLRKLTLNNLSYDPSFVRERLAYDLMREAGLAVPRVGWARVFVNGEEKGLYTTIETYDRVFLEDHYEAGTTTLYESDGANDGGSIGGVDVDEGIEDYSPLRQLSTQIDAALQHSGSLATMVPQVDWQQVARFLALEDVLGHFDGHKGACHNFFVHFDGEGRVTLLPWSVDLTLPAEDWFASGPLGTCGLFAQACEQDAQCRFWFERERDRAAQLVLRNDWSARILPLASSLQDFVRPFEQPFSGNEFTSGVTTDLVENATAALHVLTERAQDIRCATSAARGAAAIDDSSCGGFAEVPSHERP